MGITTEDNYLIKYLQENHKYGAKQSLKMFPNKSWSFGGRKTLIKKIDNTGTVRDSSRSTSDDHYPTRQTTVSVHVVNFFISIFSPPRLQFLLGNILSNRFVRYFLFSRKDLIKYRTYLQC